MVELANQAINPHPDGDMKSAYELAMERLEKADPNAGKPLTEEQKSALQEIDQRYAAKLAEREIFLKAQLTEARASEQDAAAVSQIENQLRNERSRIEEEKEQAKDKIRAG